MESLNVKDICEIHLRNTITGEETFLGNVTDNTITQTNVEDKPNIKTIKMDKKDLDFSKVSVGSIIDISGNCEGYCITYEGAEIKSINIEDNEITIEIPKENIKIGKS